MAPNRRPTSTDLGLLVILALLWGSSFTLIKVAVETIPPASLTAGRIALAAAILLAVVRLRGVTLPSSPAIWMHLLVQSLINLVLPFLLISWGEQHVSSGLASILTTTAPLFAFSIAAATGHAARGFSQALGLACGFGGVILIIGTGALTELGGPQLLSQLALVAAGFCYGSSSNYGRVFRSISPIAVGAGTLLWATLLTVPLSLVLDRPWTLQPSAESVGAVLLLGVLSTALAFSIYFRLLGTLGTVGTSTVGYLRVGFGVILGILFLGEHLTLASAAGLGLIVLGVAAINGQLGRVAGLFRRPTAAARS
ncbi:MAG TPA: EamA family transporter [Methylomirabilota bacterium]|jgi:drug/metabolite transporter (DMT)-like permease|nr:EamA family transporter [Methylomirabilota bacterium]